MKCRKVENTIFLGKIAANRLLNCIHSQTRHQRLDGLCSAMADGRFADRNAPEGYDRFLFTSL